MQETEQEPLKRIFEHLITLLYSELEDDLLGILATGSRIHGTPGPTSDLDAHVIIASQHRRRRNLILDGMEIELFINPAAQVRRYMEDENGLDQHMFTFGRAIYDPQGIIARLQSEARALWEAGPSPLSTHTHWQHRYHAADMLRDLEDIGDDEATANLLIARLVEELIATHYKLHQRWPEKLKRRLADLERWDATAAHRVRIALGHGSTAQKHEALQQLAEHILAPIGGLMPLEWATEWEEVQL